MAVHDRWHTRKPRTDPATGRPGLPCEHSRRDAALYPSAEHGQGDRWQVRWRDDDGKQCSANRPRKGGRKGESDPDVYAEALDAKIASELNTDTYIDPGAGKILLEDYAKQWRSGLVIDPQSLETIDDRLAHIYDVEPGPRSRRPKGNSPIGRQPIARLAKRPSLIQQWVKSLQAKGLSNNYISQIAGTLSSVFIAAIDDNLVARNPVRAKSVRLPPLTEVEIIPWTAEQVDAGRAALRKAKLPEAMIDVGVGAGLREAEMFALAEDDIVFLGRDRHINVRRQIKRVKDSSGKWHMVFAPPKRRKVRKVDLADVLGARLARHIRDYPPVEVTLPWDRPDGKSTTVRLLFVRRPGVPWYDQLLSPYWDKVRTAAGVPATRENGYHILRHTYASEQLAGGVDIRSLAANLGHSDPGFTLRRYTHFIPRTAERSRAAVDAFFMIAEQSARNVP